MTAPAESHVSTLKTHETEPAFLEVLSEDELVSIRPQTKGSLAESSESLAVGIAGHAVWHETDGMQTMLGFRERPGLCEGVHDVPGINVVLLTQPPLTVAVVSLDLCLLDHTWQQTLRDRIRQELGMESIVACTHTHAGPTTAHTTFAPVDEAFLDRLPDRILATISAAQERSSRVATTKAASAKYFGNFTMNRTHVDASGNLHTLLRSDTPARVFGLGDDPLPLDRELNVIQFQTQADTNIALVNFGCHPNVQRFANRQLSRDFPGSLVDFLRRQEGIEAVFLNGVAGDVRPAMGEESWEAVEAFGAMMGSQTLDALARYAGLIFDPASIRLKFRQQRLEIPLTDGTTASAELSCLWIGSLPIVTIPGELYSSLGLRIKEGFRPTPMIVGYANGNLGYIPDERCFREHHPYDIPLNTWPGEGQEKKALYLPGFGVPAVEPEPEIGEIVVETARSLLSQEP